MQDVKPMAFLEFKGWQCAFRNLYLVCKTLILKGEMYYVRDFKRFYRLTEYGHSKWSVHLLSSNLNDVNINTLWWRVFCYLKTVDFRLYGIFMLWRRKIMENKIEWQEMPMKGKTWNYTDLTLILKMNGSKNMARVGTRLRWIVSQEGSLPIMDSNSEL